MTKLEDFKSLYDHDYTPVFQQQKVQHVIKIQIEVDYCHLLCCLEGYFSYMVAVNFIGGRNWEMKGQGYGV